MTDAAIIYRTHVEAIELLPEEEQLKAYRAIVAYCMDDILPDDMIGRYTVGMAKPLLDKWKAKRDAGAKGGSKRKQTEATEKQAEANGSNPQPKVKEKEFLKDKDKEINKERETKHKHGAYKHVLLTDQQYKDLLAKYGEPAANAWIKRVDEYCETTGKRYKNYALTIMQWDARDKGKPPDKRRYFNDGAHRNDGTDEAKRKLIELSQFV